MRPKSWGRNFSQPNSFAKRQQPLRSWRLLRNRSRRPLARHAFADFVRRKSRDLRPPRERRDRRHGLAPSFRVRGRGHSETSCSDLGGSLPSKNLGLSGDRRHDLVRSFRVRRSAIRGLRNGLGGRFPAENLGLHPGGLGMGTAPMGGEKRAPSLERPDPLGNPIVKLLVDKRCSRRVDGDNVRCRLCGYQGLVEDDGDLIKPFKLGDISEVQRSFDDKADRKPQRQNDRVFEKRVDGNT